MYRKASQDIGCEGGGNVREGTGTEGWCLRTRVSDSVRALGHT